MNLGDLYQMVCDRVDDIPDELMVTRWMENGQSRLASFAKASFPPFVTNETYDPNFTPVFDSKWHEALVVFACARYKETESSLQEVTNFQQQFEELKKEFAQKYQVPVQYQDDDDVQQFTGIAGNTTFTITKGGFDPNYSNLQVYLNGNLITDWSMATNPPANPDGSQGGLTSSIGSSTITTNSVTINNTFILGSTIPTLLATDIITAQWNNESQLAVAPYPWMQNW